MPKFSRAAISAASALALALSATAVPTTAAAGGVGSSAIDGMSGCYMYSWWHINSLFHGMAGYCETSGGGVVYFDWDGNYGGYQMLRMGL